MALYKPGSSSTGAPSTSLTGPTEFDILKASHKFLREDDEDGAKLAWEDKIAQKYYSSLYREYAVCDLKHYKSGNFALRWRTEEEVISGAGETTCGNTRCTLHAERNINPDDPRCALKTLELPFSYAEDGETKFALVKVVLCEKCVRKLMWKRKKEKQGQRQRHGEEGQRRKEKGEESGAEETDDRGESSRAAAREQLSVRGDAIDPDRDAVGGSPGRGNYNHDKESRRLRHSERRRHGYRGSRSRSPRRGAAWASATTMPRRRSRSPKSRERE